ncbi:MAG: hypothetical protein WBB28_19545 [Crinalium sp.]
MRKTTLFAFLAVFLANIPSTYAAPKKPAPRVSPPTVVVQKYFNTIINDDIYAGDKYWCSQSKQFLSRFFAPTKYRIIRGDVHKAGGIYTVQLNSSNKSGQPIIARWKVFVDKEKNAKIAKGLPYGYCISIVDE